MNSFEDSLERLLQENVRAPKLDDTDPDATLEDCVGGNLMFAARKAMIDLGLTGQVGDSERLLDALRVSHAKLTRLTFEDGEYAKKIDEHIAELLAA